MTDNIFEPSAYDYYDYDAMEKLQKHRSKKYMDLFRKWYKANEKKDKQAIKKAIKAMNKHKEQDEILRERSQQSGYYWY